jgi:hypothetical protein
MRCPIDPPAMNPRVAAQEGRFIIFGRTQDLLEEELRLDQREDGTGIEGLRLEQVRFRVEGVGRAARELMINWPEIRPIASELSLPWKPESNQSR